MKRDLDALATSPFDLVVIGGGIHGAFAAWDAALRGLRVALIERGDFGGATSSNSLKIAHGGLRHLQSGNIAAVRESLDEQIALRRIAPHLVRPLPCVMELRTSLTRNPIAVRAAMGLYASVARARARQLGAGKFPAAGRLMGSAELAALLAPLPIEWRAGALWFDAIIESPERLLIGVVRAAAEAGAVVASYVEARTISANRDGITISAIGVGAEPIEIRARLALNAAGPWAPELAARWGGAVAGSLARACNVVVRAPAPGAAVALRHPSEPRMLFAVPWRGHMMIGTSYVPASLAMGARPDRGQVDRLLSDFNAAVPGSHLSTEDVTLVHGGLLPAVDQLPMGSKATLLQSRAQLIDHRERDGLDGIISMVGVKWTTARRVAERAVDLCQRRLQLPVRRGGTDRRPIAGAVLDSPERSVEQPPPHRDCCPDSSRDSFRDSFRRDLYGTLAAEVDTIAASRPDLATAIAPGSAVIGAQVVHAIRYEMAMSLDDIVLRRTELGTTGIPTEPELASAARIAASELGWSAPRLAQELARVRETYQWGTR